MRQSAFLFDAAEKLMPRMPNVARSSLVPCGKAGAIALLFVLLAGCGKGFHDADINAVEQEIKTEFGKRALRVTSFDFTKDSDYQISGLVTVQMETSMGVRDFFTPCVATMDPSSRHFTWKCESVP